MNPEIKAIVDKLTPRQKRARMKEIKRRLQHADDMNEICVASAQKVHDLEQELVLAKKQHIQNWSDYMNALEECPHPCCI